MYLAKGGRKGSALYRGLLALERWTLRSADVVITTNESHAHLEHERGGVPEGSSIVVRSGPNLAKFHVTEPDPSLKQGKRFLLAYLGVIGDQDGVDHLVRALLAMRRDLGRDDIHCLVIGDGPHLPVIKELADELGVADLITFTGFVSEVDELCRLLSSSDLGVVPDPKTEWSDQSTLNKVVEYMYFGLPMVSYELTETKVSAGGAAIYAQADDVDDLAATIVGLLDDEEARARMGAIGKERVHNELAWEYSVPNLLRAYDNAFA
jgi:glycosyltransferase involved in cell wall biosynthesis